MGFRAHPAAHRDGSSFTRSWARTSLVSAVRAAAVLVLLVLLAASGWWIGAGMTSGVLWEQLGAGWHLAAAAWRRAAARAATVDGETAKRLVQSVLPAAKAGEDGVGDGERPLLAWVRAATGYDFTSPRSFLEAEVAGRRSPVRLNAGAFGQAFRAAPGRESRREGESGSGTAGGGAGGDGRPEAGPAALARSTEAPSAEVLSRQEREPVPARLAPVLAVDWGNEPRVLIVHSHTSESYVTVPPDPRADARNHVYNDSDTGITRVGRALAEKLRNVYGIGVIHSTRVHNWPHHWEAYVNSRETVKEYLEAYPSIQIVLDVHRQGIENAVWATAVSGVQAVSVEVIYTTSQEFPYASHPNWRWNAAFAEVLARAMEELHPGLLHRVTAVRDRRYNQDLHPHMVLLEVGNYLDREEHALAAAELLADAVALALYEVDRGTVEALAAPRAVTPPQPPRPAPSSPPPRR